MEQKDDSRIRSVLDQWNHQPVADPEFGANIRKRIHRQYFAEHGALKLQSDLLGAFRNLLFKPGYAVVLLAGLVIGITITGVVVQRVQWGDSQNMAGLYLAVFDPANAALQDFATTKNFAAIDGRNVFGQDTLDRTLGWVERRVNLRPAQRQDFATLHAEYMEDFRSHYETLIQLENEYREYERMRIAGESIDLLSVYENLNAQTRIFQETVSLQRVFISRILEILDNEQMGKYGELFPQIQPEVIPSAMRMGIHREWII